MQHFFDIDIAQKYDVNLAIFLKNLAYWIVLNQSKDKNLRDGRYWSYMPVSAFPKFFPYWTPKQIRTIIERGISEGLIVTGNYNKRKSDQTLWYSLSDEGHKLLNLLICPNGKMDLPKRANGFAQTGKALPDREQDIKPNIKTNRATAKPKRKKRSVSLTYYSKDFFPDDKRRELLTLHAKRTNNTEHYLLEKFEQVMIKYKKRSKDWQLAFEIYLTDEKVKKVYTNKTGGLERYDSESMYC
jgi:hypothetical protein